MHPPAALAQQLVASSAQAVALLLVRWDRHLLQAMHLVLLVRPQRKQ
jgi:hypothetical protein